MENFRTEGNGRGRGGGGGKKRTSKGREGQEKQLPPSKRPSTSTKVESLKRKLPGYRLYFYDNEDSAPDISNIDIKIEAISEYLVCKGYLQEDKVKEIDEMEYFEVRCEQLLMDSNFRLAWPDFLHDLSNEPTIVVKLWGAVMHKLVSDYINADNNNTDHPPILASGDIRGKEGRMVNNVGRIQAGLLKVDPVTSFGEINSSKIGKFVTIRGQIIRTGSIRAVCIQMPFECKVCQAEFMVHQLDGMYTLPSKCPSCGAIKQADFKPNETSDNILMMDSRRIKLQDAQEQELQQRGDVPKTIECELTDGVAQQFNADNIKAGDIITVAGVVKIEKESSSSLSFSSKANKKDSSNLFNLYIEAISTRNHRESERTVGGNWFSLSDRDYCAVAEIHDSENLLKLLVASLCPSIYGHYYVKAALLLSLFGGTPSSSNEIDKRSDIHILMVGDPGIGKSQMLKVMTDVAPKGVYVCGTGTTVSGLTATLIKSGNGLEYDLEAGAMVVADKGVCCIDELDKMIPQHSALLETMEQQTVSIAKAGVFRTLQARTTVIAAANPVEGHYNARKSLSENIKISAPLLTRFDITFLMRDKSDKDFDELMSRHIMGLSPKQVQPSENDDVSYGGPYLIDRLKVDADETLDLIPHSLIRKYVAYARQYVHPKISKEAGEILKTYYLRLRLKHKMRRNCSPITTRQLESLLRLTEATAKLELREIATENDARDALEIFGEGLTSVFDDGGPDGSYEVTMLTQLGLDSVATPPTTTTKPPQKLPEQSTSFNKPNQLLSTLQKLSETTDKKVFTADEIKDTIKLLGIKSSPEHLIDKLNNEGLLLLKGHGLYQLNT